MTYIKERKKQTSYVQELMKAELWLGEYIYTKSAHRKRACERANSDIDNQMSWAKTWHNHENEDENKNQYYAGVDKEAC